MEWDVFISHASEDKDDFVRPLGEALRKLGYKVWLDEFTIVVGDSLRQSIDRGLAHSRFGIVVISPDFLAKPWPQRELDGLVAREIEGGKVILPVWHNIDRAGVVDRSPTLADRLAVSSAKGLEYVVAELVRAMQRDDPSLPTAPSADHVGAPSPARSGLLSVETLEQAETFSSDRCTRIAIGGFLPTVLAQGPKLTIHVMPGESFRAGAEIDHVAMQSVRLRFKPPRAETCEESTMVDGWQLWDPPVPAPPLPNPVSRWNSLVLNSGISEVAVCLDTESAPDQQRAVAGYPLERDVVELLDQIAEGCAGLKMDQAPAMLKLTLLDVLGVRLKGRTGTNNSRGFDRGIVALPIVQVSKIAKPMGNLLRPVFDRLWRAAGWSSGTQSFEDGTWAGYGDGRLPRYRP
jgi:hypothetical protein